jgi:hypothetical protein
MHLYVERLAFSARGSPRERPRSAGRAPGTRNEGRHRGTPSAPVQSEFSATRQALMRHRSAVGVANAMHIARHPSTVKVHRCKGRNGPAYKPDENGKLNGDRDLNAPRNMLGVLKMELAGPERPAYVNPEIRVHKKEPVTEQPC